MSCQTVARDLRKIGIIRKVSQLPSAHCQNETLVNASEKLLKNKN